MSSETITLKLDRITVDEDVQIRMGGLDEDKVREYAEVVDQLPPVDVFLEDGVCWLADGFHRYEAHQRAGCAEIQARVHQGGRRAAAEHSILANARHGLPMNRAEKKRAVRRMLVFHPDWSNNRLASRLRLVKSAGRPAEPPTEEMIAFAMSRLEADGECSQRSVRGWHQAQYGQDVNSRRAAAAIEEAERRLAERALRLSS